MVKIAAKDTRAPTTKKALRIPNTSAIKPPTKGPESVPAKTPDVIVPRA